MVTVLSLRKRLFELWVKNPYTTPKKACEELKEPWPQRRKYVKKLLSEFRSYHNLASPQQAHRLEHRVFEWENIPRVYKGGDRMPVEILRVGWCVVVNRNDMWVFRDPRGSVHWYRGGLVRLYLKGELQLAKAKEVFCRAFSWFTNEQLKKFLDVPLVEKYRKWIFEIGSPMPKFDIKTFERSHGLRIFTDGSHRTSLHVGEATPFWIDEQRQATAEFGVVVNQFGVEIREHMKLIRLWQDEAKGLRLRSVVC